MFEEALKTLNELVAQLSRLNDNLEASNGATKVESPAAKSPEKPQAKKPVKAPKPAKAAKPVEEEREDDDDDDLDYQAEGDDVVEVTVDEVKELAKKAITEGVITKDDIKGKITEVGADSLADCSPEQLSQVYDFIKESL